RLESQGANDTEQLKAAQHAISALDKQLEGAQDQLDYFDSEHKRAELRAETAEQQLRAARFRIEELSQRLQQRGESVDKELIFPGLWRVVESWCDHYFAGRLVLAPGARQGVRNPEFKDVQLAARCLRWLAVECRNSRMNGGAGSLREF